MLPPLDCNSNFKGSAISAFFCGAFNHGIIARTCYLTLLPYSSSPMTTLTPSGPPIIARSAI